MEHSMMKLRLLVTALIFLALTLTIQSVAYAAGVVGTGSAASCTEAAFNKALAGGGTITFNCGAAAATINITTEKTIAANTSIDGAGRITLNAGGRTRIFFVNPHQTLGQSNLKIMGGSGRGNAYANNYGGAIFNRGTLAVVNVIFTGNKTYEGGGAISNAWNSTANITGSTFTNNSAGVDVKRGGGAIFNNTEAKLNVSNSTFTGNIANPGIAGAIYNLMGTAVVTNCKFINNTGVDGGGALYSDTGPFTVTDSTFTGNKAGVKGSGGAIHTESPFTINHSTFTGNTADVGGAIATTYKAGFVVAINNSTISGNTAKTSGGVFTTGADMIITGTTITGNKGSFVGGLYHSSGGNLTVKTSTITNNTATSGGNCSGTIIDGGGNKQYPGATCGATIPVAP
jgi:predicted outer membrane repeat protein